MSDFTVPSNVTVPISDLIRARVASQRLTMPVQGAGTMMLEHITAVPALGEGGGYSVNRLQALDRLIGRIQGTMADKPEFEDLSEVEKQEQVIEELVNRIVEDSRREIPQLGMYQGLVMDFQI